MVLASTTYLKTICNCKMLQKLLKRCHPPPLTLFIRALVIFQLVIIIVIMWKVSSRLSGRPFSENLISRIRNRHLSSYDPALETDYSPSRPAWVKFNNNWNQTLSKFVIQQFNFTKNGFFIECGALDGQFLSNSLLLEKEYNWTGLLIEADPQPLKILKKRNRHAWVADVCLSPKPYHISVMMTGHTDVIGHGYIDNDIVSPGRNTERHKYNRKFVGECYPLDMVLEAVRPANAPVEYLSLDVEGVELDILQTIPFHQIPIKMISVEVRPENKDNIRIFLESVGYTRILEVVIPNEFIHDDVYMMQN